jgi:hypothetical protein
MARGLRRQLEIHLGEASQEPQRMRRVDEPIDPANVYARVDGAGTSSAFAAVSNHAGSLG